MTAILAGGGLGGVLLLMICLVAGVFAVRGMLSNNAAETPAVEAIASVTPVVVVAGINPSPTLLSTPIAAAPSTPSPTARPAVTSTPTAPPGVPFVRINRIATDSEDTLCRRL